MAFCKICVCGEKIEFEKRLSFPDTCPSCSRRLIDYLTYNVDDPEVELIIKRMKEEQQETKKEDLSKSEGVVQNNNQFRLCLENNKCIEIPEEGGIIGRAGIGADVLGEFPSVSRQHLKIVMQRNNYLIVEDISKYGTFIDGCQIEKNMPVRINPGSKLTLCNVEMIFNV